MASNKERIETNNTRLSAISTQLDDLPPKVNLDATTITPGIENQVISSGTYLNGDLTVLGDSDLVAGNIKQGVNIFGVDGTFDNSHGAYVWKKYENKIYSFLPVNTTGTNLAFLVNGVGFNAQEVTTDFFVGFTGGTCTLNSITYEFSFNDNGILKMTNSKGNSGEYTYSYDPSTAIITTDWGNNDCSWVTSFSREGKVFLNFVVSDSPTAYPDGGEQGGYWYEKVVEGRAGVDFGEVTLASSQLSVKVSHKLGVTPSWVALLPKSGLLSPSSYTNCFGIIGTSAIFTTRVSSDRYPYVAYYILTESSDDYALKNGSEITFSFRSAFDAGTYYWVAIA